MYDFFRGRVLAIDANGQVSLDVNGIGYLLRISEQTRQSVALDGSEITIYARLIVKEDDLRLFGFADTAERAAFDLVTTVQGVGPAAAMEMLSLYSTDQLRQILANRDSSAIMKTKGIGKKTAERLIIDLHDKVERIPVTIAELEEGKPATAAASTPSKDEAYRALVALGFSPRDSEIALENVDPSSSTEEMVRAALTSMR